MLALTKAGTIEHKQLDVDLWSIKHNKLKASRKYYTSDKFLLKYTVYVILKLKVLYIDKN